MPADLTRLERTLNTFLAKQDHHSFVSLLRAQRLAREVPAQLDRRVCDAVFLAAQSSDWRLAAEAIDEFRDIVGALKRTADVLARGLLSKYKSVRIASWGAILCRRYGLRLSRMVLSRLEAKPTAELMVWEVLMAVDQMADYLTSERDRKRLVQFVKRLEAHGTRSYLVEWKIEETLYSDLHLNQPRDQ